jgi:hypothetical protein
VSCTFGRAGDDRRFVHDAARDLAAARLDGPLAPEDETWLADHLNFCDACAVVAAEYDAQHDLFTDLRAWTPEPPRDLWARTSSAIDAERGHRSGAARLGLRGRTRRTWRRLSLAPVVAVVAVVAVVSAGLLNVPLGTGGIAAPTPIAVSAAADLQVIGRDSQGNVQILRRPVDAVCPAGLSVCGAQPTFAVTSVSGVASATTLQGAISPSGDRMVVVAKDQGGEGVYVVPVTAAATAAPTRSAAPAASATAAPASSHPVAVASSPSPTAPASPASESATPSDGSTTASTPPDASSSPASSPSASPTEAPTSAAPASTPTPMPTVEVTPAPDAAIKIASDVTVVGVPMYAPDGVHLAFAAMPSGGSTGPDIYVWASDQKTAQAITSDHNSWLAAWTADGILASRVSDGTPATYRLDPVSGHATAVGDPGIWLPALTPDGSSAAWWAGTVKLAADGVTWVPDSGKLVAGGWPIDSGASPEVIAKGALAAWQVRWSDDGTAMAVWTVAAGKGSSGRLSLFHVNPSTSIADLANPMLDAVPANPDFSLRNHRLAWTTPTQGVPQVVEVLAWSGKTIGRVEIPADGSGTVVP